MGRVYLHLALATCTISSGVVDQIKTVTQKISSGFCVQEVNGIA